MTLGTLDKGTKEGRKADKKAGQKGRKKGKKSERGIGNAPPTLRKKMVFRLGGTTGGAIYYPLVIYIS